jgi:hypothetical protein
MADDLEKDLSRSEKLLKDRLIKTGKVVKDITNKAFRELIENIDEYGRSLDSISDSLEEQLDTYSKLKDQTKVLGETLNNNLKYTKGNKDLSQRLVNIYKDQNKLIEKSTRNQKDLLTGELSSKQVNDDLLKANTQSLNILLRQRDINSEIERQKGELSVANEDEKESINDKIKGLEKINEELKLEKTNLEDITKDLEKQAESAKDIENKLGLGGRILKAFKKIPVLGDLLDVSGAEAAMKAVAAEGGSMFAILGAGAQGLGVALESALGPFGLIIIAVEAIQAVAKFFKDAMFAASKQIADFQRNLGVSRDSASEIRDRFYEISTNAEDLYKIQKGNSILQKDLVEAQESFNAALGLAIDLSTEQNEKFAVQFTNIKKFYNLNEQEQKGLVNLNAINNETLDETKNSILGQAALYKINTKEAINIRKVYKDILTTSNSTKLSIKGGTDALIQSTLNAQKLGIKLDDLKGISDNLLNFEESISSELEAELILGRDLELEKARAAALMNDQVTLTEEVNRLVRESGPDFEKNRIAMQASAKAIGIGVDELADMVTQQRVVEKFKQDFNALDEEAIKNSKILSNDEKKRLIDKKGTAEDYYKFAKEQGKDLVEILGDEQASRMEAQDAQQKFNDALEKAKETFTRFVDGGALDKLADILDSLADKFSVGITGAITGTGKEIAKERKGAKESEKYAEGLSANEKAAYDEGLQKKLAEELITQMKVNAVVQPINTLLSSREENLERAKAQLTAEYYEDTVLPAKDFVIKTLPEDTVVGMGGTALGRTDEMVALLTQQNQHLDKQNTLLASIYNKEGTIVLNGTKMGTGMNVGGYKTA